ncbi:FecR family protein [Autumnicola musiva]|uniref:FecR domain-containing protein n=1 Tax=Autumnicola musiva TaxID=3075589 RepID=A0ABU3DCD5_9FLAO|nr:FecR domain-containing protein [Zunongwangia sp. F117]MDT0678633.1 FecR domain-containing protein [Zunongwangia sp. F117]
MHKEDFIRLSKKYSENRCNAQEKKIVEEVLDKLEEKSKNNLPDLSDDRKEKMLFNILNNIETSKPNFNNRFLKKMAIAAVFSIMIGAAFWISLMQASKPITRFAGKGEKKEFLLEDGSIVTLNSNSSITYFENFKDKRDINLKGEAFFKVARNPSKPFTITTGQVKTSVLGTSFNINAYNYNQVKVSVNTGKVKVESNKNKQRALLSKDEQVLFEKGRKHKITQGLSADFNAWTRNIILLNNTSLAETAKILENWYDIKIEFEQESLGELRISGKFKEQEIKSILESIAYVKSLEIDTTNQNHIRIRRKTENLN